MVHFSVSSLNVYSISLLQTQYTFYSHFLPNITNFLASYLSSSIRYIFICLRKGAHFIPKQSMKYWYFRAMMHLPANLQWLQTHHGDSCFRTNDDDTNYKLLTLHWLGAITNWPPCHLVSRSSEELHVRSTLSHSLSVVAVHRKYGTVLLWSNHQASKYQCDHLVRLRGTLSGLHFTDLEQSQIGLPVI